MSPYRKPYQIIDYTRFLNLFIQSIRHECHVAIETTMHSFTAVIRSELVLYQINQQLLSNQNPEFERISLQCELY